MAASNGSASAQASTSTSRAAAAARYSQMPQDARLIALIIASMGIQDIQPGVEMMLLEWSNRYIHTVLSDSLVYSSHAHPSASSNPQITLPDLILAVQSNLSHSMIQQPSKMTLLSLATTLNAAPLPPISDRYGLRLPPRQHCLTNVNFNIVPDPLDDDDDDDDDGDGDQDGRSMTGDEQQNGRVVPPSGSRGQNNGTGLDTEGNSPLPEDATMEQGEQQQDETTTPSSSNRPLQQQADARGVKRNLDEDEDYD